MTDNSLNLDTMLGSKKLTVRFQDKEYQIRAVESLTPEEFGLVIAYGEKFSAMTEEQMEVNGGQTVMKAIDDLLEIIGPSLPRHRPSVWERIRAKLKRQYVRKFVLSVHQCVAVMQFWNENNRKNAMGAAVPAKRAHR